MGESVIALWLRSKGYTVIPAYEKQADDWKGPRVFLPSGKLVAPDMFCLITRGATTYGMWVEAKTKSRFTWYRNGETWQTGIDEPHFNDYNELQRVHHLPVFLMFYHQNPTPSADDLRWGSPPDCPTGLFVGRLDVLLSRAQRGRGYYQNGRYRPMVYWDLADLSRYATLPELYATLAQSNALSVVMS